MNLEKWKIKNKKSRNYSHFDSRVYLDKVWDYIKDPNKIKRHGFYPFIHYTQSFKRYSKHTGIKKKNREICYSAHLDRFIYSYYSYQLNNYYNNRVKIDGINDSAIAYRDNIQLNNIHFAKKAIDFIRQKEECYIIIGDFTKFFDSLDHTYLKKMLCSLLEVEKFPDDFYAVFKNITKFSTWDMESLLNINNLKNNPKDIIKFKQLKKAISPEQYKKYKKLYIKKNSNNYGIPQGSAISAVLSNVYMLEFDKKIKTYVSEKNGLYMRYSDDFIVILPKITLEDFKEDLIYIETVIKSVPKLQLEQDKTQLFAYSNKIIRSCNEEFLENVKNGKPFMNYLGFTFDGQDVTLRDKTVSKYYYRLYRKIKTIIKNNGVTKKGKRISSKNVYLKYSIKGSKKGKGNFITYVKRVEQIFSNEKGVAQISRKHMQKIRKQLNKIK
ncbi:hypothetical protein BP422_02375 [Brevibacillus formosus]|uniref:Reverse transcriptase domain-containing protein n=1 Tax=Brevibacillus formosus TaxID=54913 RepID=A0A220MBV8_9BACL|nr:reverse transcriptase/maturase family protein [Brevibacillus formosus]ASJ52491.1 hypothetical protein BP422_02375 [Brevibacillus formosus]